MAPEQGPAASRAKTPTEAAAAPVQRTLCARILQHLKEWFVFVGLPEVPPDNNATERSLRPLVTSRKISGGTRSDVGTAAKTTLASLSGTWQICGLDPLDQCRHLLASPQLYALMQLRLAREARWRQNRTGGEVWADLASGESKNPVYLDSR